MSVAIQELLIRRLKNFKFQKDTDYAYCFDNTLKASLLTCDIGIDINIVENTEFTVVLDEDDYSKIIANDFYFAYNRISKLKKDLLVLAEAPTSAPWKLVTAYYISFFCAIEIAKLYGIFNLNLDKKDKSLLCAIPYIGGNKTNIDSFIESDITSFYGSSDKFTESGKIIIKFKNGGGKPHKLAWDNLNRVLNKCEKNTSDKYYDQLLEILDEHKYWLKPSSIRNEWNYYRSDYFMDNHAVNSKMFNSIVQNYNAINHWMSVKVNPSSTIDQAASIGFIYQVLVKTIENLGPKLIDINESSDYSCTIPRSVKKNKNNKKNKRKK